MPIFEYVCQDCEAQYEVLVRNGNEPRFCDKCFGKLARKLSRTAAVQRPDSIGREGPSDKEIAASGLTKYVKDESGAYRKVAGDGETWLGGDSI